MTGTMKVKIEGLNSSKIINRLIERGVFLKNIKEKYRYTIFDINERDEFELKSICKKFHKRYEILSKNNFIRLLKKTKYYFGFIVAFVLVFSFVFSFNLFVYEVNVKVSSDIAFDTKKLEQMLKDNGIYVGMKRSDIDKTSLQNRIISSDENIAGCSVKQNGGRLNIVILPALLKGQMQKENVYSKYNAVISKVNIFAGKTTLKVGDIVKKDDLLVENDNGVSGEILGKVYYSDYLIYNENQVQKVFTGNCFEEKLFELLGFKLNKQKKNIEFSNYLEENCVFYVSKYNFLPLKMIKKKYKEFEYKDIVISFEKQEDELKQKLYEQVLSKMEENIRGYITNVTYSVVTENNLTRLDCFVECEINLVTN